MRNVFSYVYAIQHNKTKRIYVGTSTRPEERYRSHISSLKRNEHSVETMQEDFNTYGEDFSFFILEKVKHDRVYTSYGSTIASEHMAEYDWMRKLGTTQKEVGYNYKDRAAILYAKNCLFNHDIPYVEGIPVPLSVSVEIGKEK
ncbi:MAG: GIY-YIG nuclease family protein [Bacteroidales bacterium]|nr:GIY-YIG nuclease family protein [Bacteroidales bacterium]